MDDRIPHPTPGDPQPMPPAIELALGAGFGCAGRWREAFFDLGKAGAGGRWLLLSWLPREGRLVNRRSDEVDHAPDGGMTLLALDIGTPDGRPDAGDAVDALVRGLDWAGVDERYQQAVARCSQGLGATADEAAAARLIDVRRAAVFDASGLLAEGAVWRDPAQVDAWARQLPADEPVVVYCVHGHAVSRAVALRLRAVGIEARFLVGGLEGWRAQGRPTARPSGR